MPVRIDAPSWFSAIRADDKPVYLNPASLNSEGVIRTGKSLKGRLVSIAESLGIFKDYVSDYRVREVVRNRNAYEAVWDFVANNCDATAERLTREGMEKEGYSRVSRHIERLRGRDANDPQRAVCGRELRLILDTFRGVEEMDRRLLFLPVAETLTTDGDGVDRTWQGSGDVAQQVATQNGTEVMKAAALSGSSGDAWQDAVAEANTLGVQDDAVKRKPDQASKELRRAMLANNKESNRELLHQMLGSKEQLMETAQELGYDPKAIATRQSYIQAKLEDRLSTDLRAQSGKLSTDEMRALVGAVFDKALEKSTVVAGIRGAMLGTASKMKQVLDEDSPDLVDVLKLSKDKIKAAVRDGDHLKKLVDRAGMEDKKISETHRRYIEQRAIDKAAALVEKTKVELSSAQVDDILVGSLPESLGVGKSRARMRGVLDKAARTVNPPSRVYKRSVEDVLEEAAYEEPPQVLVETADERAQALNLLAQDYNQLLEDAWDSNVVGRFRGEVPSEATHTTEGDVLEKAADDHDPQPPPPLVEATDEPAAVAAPSQLSTSAVKPSIITPSVAAPSRLSSPEPYKGTDYFDQSDSGVIRLPMRFRNRNAAKQVATDKAYLAASMPEDSVGKELTSKQCTYIKTTLLRHVADHGVLHPNERLGAKALYDMMRPITTRALEQNDRTLGAKILYKNVAKHIGRKEAPVRGDMQQLLQKTRTQVDDKIGGFTQEDGKFKTGGGIFAVNFVQRVAQKTNIAIHVDAHVVRAIRSDTKKMAQDHVENKRRALTDSDLENIIAQLLREYAR